MVRSGPKGDGDDAEERGEQGYGGGEGSPPRCSGSQLVFLGLVFGAASVALGANGDNFVLGQNNVATVLTRLTGSVQGPSLQVQNDNPGTNDTALALNVQQGEAADEGLLRTPGWTT